ncbi:aminoglycoside phosphotransferase family protein [Opitutus sp. ER46]|uniref:phosphotransferase enzyme family protein n=1 Tax=Opitutus sp. ER46 TaxID=2161864 RepID=UPI000D2F79FC|nr:aminoglycoside phosphotransferase family protein [Opitutus sp. ER46]PTX96547.1 mucin desulfatase [Opitutus sp. ER46]
MSSTAVPLNPPDLAALAKIFATDGSYVAGAPHGTGHINDTFALTMAQGDRRIRYILQRINHRIFKDVPALMENVERVTAHARQRLERSGITDTDRRVLRVIPTRAGRAYHEDAAGGFWRCYAFIEGARTHDLIETPRQAYEAARAFGEFQSLLVDLPGGRLHETIPAFHDTRRRFDTFRRILQEDPRQRAVTAAAEIEFVLSREPMVDVLLNLQRRGAIPERITHNDTKLNNVMLDDVTQEGVCVIDLDTVMPGLALYDFGDMVRSATNAAAEDERDLAKVTMRMPIYEALVAGYLSSAGKFLTDAERAHLAFSGKLITFEIGLRFLTDHLEGDVYFKIHRPGHNLDRARNQFALVRSIEAQEAAMNAVAERTPGAASRTS